MQRNQSDKNQSNPRQKPCAKTPKNPKTQQNQTFADQLDAFADQLDRFTSE